MLTRNELVNSIRLKLEEGIRDVDAIADSLNDGRVYDLISAERANVISWINFNKTDRVLQLGEGCGVVTGYIASEAEGVCSVICDDDERLLNQRLNEGFSNIAWLSSIEEADDSIFDKIVIMLPADVKTYHNMIKFASECLADDGSIFLVCENRFGLQNWNGRGCADGVFGALQAGNTSLSARDVEVALDGLGLPYIKYYPYPGYKFTRNLFSNDRLPVKGELQKYYNDNFEFENLELFRENLLLEELNEQGRFDFFCNAYVYAIGKCATEERRLLYAKYSTDRAGEFAISTEIIRDESGRRFVRKSPMTGMSVVHVKKLKDIEKALCERFGAHGIDIVPSDIEGDSAVSPFCKGRTLEDLLEERYEAGAYDEVCELVEKFASILFADCVMEDFVPDEEFCKVFKDVEIKGSFRTNAITNLDFNFDNILISDRWNVIDYEWSFSFPIPQEYVLYRTLMYWNIASAGRTVKSFEDWLSHFGIDSRHLAAFKQMEDGFQSYVNGRDRRFFAFEAEKYKKRTLKIDTLLGFEGSLRYLSDERQRLAKIIDRDENRLVSPKKLRLRGTPPMEVMGSLDEVKQTDGRIEVRGWTFITNFEYNDKNILTILIKNRINNDIISLGEPEKELRTDLSLQFSDMINILHSGFHGSYDQPLTVEADKEFDIGISISNEYLGKDMQIWFE